MKDTLFASALKALKMNGLFSITSKLEDWHLEDGLLFFKDRCFIPSDEDLRWNITTRYHDSLPGEHPGHLKILKLICQNYWWPGMTVFIKNYIAGCAICQQMKFNTHPSAPSLFSIKTQTNALLFSQVTCDFITDLPECDGFDSLMVMINHGSSKRGNFYPLQQNDRCNTDSPELHQPCLPMIWPPWLFPLRQRTPIQLSCLQRDDATSWSQNTPKYSISPLNWWRNRMCEPGTRDLFLDLWHKQPQNVEIIEPPHGIQPQPEGPFGNKTITILPHDGVQTQRYPLGIWEHQHTRSRTKIKDPQRSQKRGFRSTWTCQTTDGRMVYMRIYTLWERSEGMAWRQEPEDRIRIPKTCSIERRALWDNRSHGTCHLPSKTPGPIANSPCLPCLSLITLSRDWDPQLQLSAASTWSYRRRRRVQSWSNHHTQETKERSLIPREMDQLSLFRKLMAVVKWLKRSPRNPRGVQPCP